MYLKLTRDSRLIVDSSIVPSGDILLRGPCHVGIMSYKQKFKDANDRGLEEEQQCCLLHRRKRPRASQHQRGHTMAEEQGTQG